VEKRSTISNTKGKELTPVVPDLSQGRGWLEERGLRKNRGIKEIGGAGVSK